MKTRLLLFPSLVIFLFFSCKQEKKTPEGPTQMEKVMAIHDEVMPKMGKLGKLVGELKAKVDTTETGLQYEAAMKDLQGANTAMMDWMMNFGDRFDSEEILEGKELTEQKQLWLDEEEEKVRALRDQINQSLENAEALLQKEE
ncbi:hypothetical protein [Flagellimonas allohymeniacidonis]|uniref:Viral A-type inclusion protein n=1 Tax=Flagellimonas allohymeniacidonis TaxID=2517819 RepID=A0A4Q8QE54_9FLAO|nr:hypothetical protein [Allomuricauda hymeniacidonis]TAI47877.1 hypothetical protein EW142_14590 [Allomuricauda hymeniacidonis]